MTIGNRVIDLLKQKKLKQKDLAAYLHTGTSTISGWNEPNRNPSSDMIIPICDFLGVSCEYLLTGEDKGSTPLSQDDSDWLMLIHKLPVESRYELKGYAKRMLAEAATAPDADSDTPSTVGIPTSAADRHKLAEQVKKQKNNTTIQAG